MWRRASAFLLSLVLAFSLQAVPAGIPLVPAQSDAECRDIAYESLAGVVPAVLCLPAGVETARPGIVYLHGSGGADETLPQPYGGIGARLEANPLRIGTPFPDSPAEAAGLLAGDEIIAIDGFPAAQLAVDDAIPLVRGEHGSTVHLTIARPGRPGTEELGIVRAVIGPVLPTSVPMPIWLPRDLAAQGFVALGISYFALTPAPGPDPGMFTGAPPEAIADAFPTWMQVVTDGVTFLRGQPDVDPTRIGLVGWSMGTRLGLRHALRDHRYSVVVAISWGAREEAIPAGVAELPPVLILHGDADANAPVSRAFALRDALDAAGRPYELEIYPNGDHYWRDQQGRDGFDRLVAFLWQTLEME